MAAVSMTVNGKPVSGDVDPRTLLVQFLRETLRLTGTHVGCDTSQCGACVVHVDGKAIKSCTVLALRLEGANVLTIEGLAPSETQLHPMQEAFRENHGLQCGYCTPGMIMTAVDIVRRKGHDIDDKTIREELEGNICRCTGYHNIVKAIAAAAKTMRNYDDTPKAANMITKNEDAKLLAGGMSLLPTMKLRLAGPPQILDMWAIEGLSGIEEGTRSITIGAMTKHFEVNTSPVVQKAIPVLAHMAGLIGDPAVRHMGTIGGSVANNDPNADYPAACLGLGATIITNKRRIPADDFFTGMFSTALEPSEIITKVIFPIPKKAAYQKFRNQASRFALVGVFVAKRGSEIRVAVTGAGANGVFRVPSF